MGVPPPVCRKLLRLSHALGKRNREARVHYFGIAAPDAFGRSAQASPDLHVLAQPLAPEFLGDGELLSSVPRLNPAPAEAD